MLSSALRRGAFISHKLFSSLSSSPQRCCTSSLPRLLLPPRPSPSLLARPLYCSAARPVKRLQPGPPELPERETDLHKSPRPALYLWLGGLQPFMGPVIYMAVHESFIPELAYAQVAYGASILSFLGGSKWGFTLPASSPAKPDWVNLVNSVVLPLMAWIAMLLTKNIFSAAVMVIIWLAITLHNDLYLLPTYPSWFKAMCLIMTLVAITSLSLMMTFNSIYPEKSLFSEEEET